MINNAGNLRGLYLLIYNKLLLNLIKIEFKCCLIIDNYKFSKNYLNYNFKNNQKYRIRI